MPATRVLIVEDNRDLAVNIGQFLEGLRYTVDFAEDGLTGLHLSVVNDYDMIVLDVALPGLDGIALCRKLREEANKTVPTLMLTARDTLEDKLEGFRAGADDYMVKPFSLLELEARVSALIRRAQGRSCASVIRVGDLEYDPNTLTLERGDRQINLKPVTLRVLAMLMESSPRVVTKEEILREIWGEDFPDNDVLRAHIYAIRHAIDKPFDHKLLHTVHRIGYRIADVS